MVFPAASSGVLAEPMLFAVARDVRGMVSFDVDSNGLDDLIIADKPSGNARLLTALRLPGGFLPADEIILDSIAVATLRTGNFDGAGPLDIATANGRSGTVSLVYGTESGFVPYGNIFLAGSASDVAAVDLDSDGQEDLAILTERDDGISAVTSLRSDGVGFTVLGEAQELDVVGVRMLAGRFDTGDLVDLAVIAAGPDVQEYSLRTLFNRQPAPGSADPRFAVQSDTFTCPLDDRERVSRCTISDAIRADFDRDGLDDLAISMPIPGVVVLLRRHANGYDPPSVIELVGSPRGIAGGDFNGDGKTDIAITEFDTNMITIATNGPPPVCSGDCNGDGVVTVDEIVVIIQMALGERELGACLAADSTGDGAITVDEIIAAVDTALQGC
jgi:hypothetical protein